MTFIVFSIFFYDKNLVFACRGSLQPLKDTLEREREYSLKPNK